MDLFDLIGLLLAIGGSIVFFGFIIALVVYAAFQARKRKRLQTELATNAMRNPANANLPIFPVKFASGANFKSWLKLFPWEASGVLQLTDAGVVFQGAKNNGQPLQFVFSPNNTRASWIGRTFINGASSWFMLEQNGEKYYFTAETGTTIFGSKGGSEEILNAVNPRLAVVQNQPPLVS